IHRLLCDREEGEGCPSHYENTLNDYYKWLDKRIQGISEILDSDTGLLVYSPYSAVKIEGRVNLNEWLIHNGYMTLHEYPEKPTAFKHLTVDWTKTKCWSVGSSGRLYINRKGRERQGIVEYDDYDDLLDELGSKFREIHVEKGPAVQTQVFKREETHSGKYEEYGPDMFIYINNVPWNTNELVGYGLGEVFLSGQQEHSDGEYHGLYGYFCMSGSDVPAIGELKEISVLNIAPTVMEVLRLEPSMNMERPSILSMAKKKEKKSAASKKERVRSRLKALGY
ncbi:MAG: hypothetical protein GTO24_18135, partial [candidate division Zixibacteria bacterium]|nr:hypothetical protein [candidate division Zixibacteria bacterium]